MNLKGFAKVTVEEQEVTLTLDRLTKKMPNLLHLAVLFSQNCPKIRATREDNHQGG